MNLQQEVKELLESRTQSLKSIAKQYGISEPTLSKIRAGKKVSDKSLVFVKEILISTK